MGIAFATTVFVLFMALALLLFLGRRGVAEKGDQDLLRRLGYVGRTSTAAAAGVSSWTSSDKILGDRIRLLARLSDLIAQSGLELHLSKFMLILSGVFTVATMVTWTRLNLGLSLVVGAVAALFPILYLRFKRGRRLKAFNQQLPYVLDILKSGLESGHTLLRGLQLAAENAPEPLASELGLVVEQVQFGLTLPQALEDLMRRVPEEGVWFLAAAVRIQAEVGSSLAEVLLHVNELLRSAQRLQQQIRSLTAQSRLSAIVVTLLPFGVLGFFALLNPDYPKTLFVDPTGQHMLEAALVLDAIAAVLMRKISQVEY